MVYKDIIDIIKDSFTSIDIVEDFVIGSSKVNNKTRRYWCVAIDLQNITEYETERNYTFNIYAINKMVDSDNISVPNHSVGVEILSQGIDGISDILDVAYPIQYQCSSVKFADICDVVVATVTISVEKDFYCND